MTFVSADRVQETTTTTGTGDILLDGAVSGFRTFSSAIGGNNRCDYVIDGGSTLEVEVGVGTFYDVGPSLSRDKVIWSTNNNNLVDFSSGTKTVYCAVLPDRFRKKYKFPDWDTETSWEDTYLAIEALRKGPYRERTSTFGSLSTNTDKWRGGVLATNGKIYGIPSNSSIVLKIDPTNDTTSTFGDLSTTAGNVNTNTTKWSGGVLASNGMIYGIPYNADSVLKIDPTTDTATTFGSLSTNTTKWVGGVLASNGMIYGIPYDSTSILKIDPTNDTTSTFGSLSGSTKWKGGVLSPNGKIYGIPSSESSVLIIDTGTDSAAYSNSISKSSSWQSGVLAPNGKIYGIIFSGTEGAKIDPETDTWEIFGSAGSGDIVNWQCGALAPNGMVYGVPGQQQNKILKINPNTNSMFEIADVSVGGISGAVLAPNGAIYGIPNIASSVLKISTWPDETIDDNFPLSRYFNKF